MTSPRVSYARASRALPRNAPRESWCWSRTVVMLIMMLATVQMASADGGVTADSRRAGELRTTAFVAPMAPRIGIVDVSVLLTPQPSPDDGLTITVRAVHVESGIERTEQALPAHQGNRLLRSALLELPRAGRWRVEVTSASESREHSAHARAKARSERTHWPSLDFEIEVAQALPPWRSQWPWLLAWLPMSALLLWRDRLVAARRLRQSAHERVGRAGTIEV